MRASPPASSGRSRATSSSPPCSSGCAPRPTRASATRRSARSSSSTRTSGCSSCSTGPTLAFKDLALQLVGRLFDHVLTQRDERITVLVATSGDTGSAAISGLASCSRADDRRALSRGPRERRAAPPDDDGRRAQRARRRGRRHVRRLPAHRQGAVRRRGAARARRARPPRTRSTGRASPRRSPTTCGRRRRSAAARWRSPCRPATSATCSSGWVARAVRPAARAARDRLERQRHPAAPARDAAAWRCAASCPRSARAWTSRSPRISSGCCSSSTTAIPSAPTRELAGFAETGSLELDADGARRAARPLRGRDARRRGDARGDARRVRAGAARCSTRTRAVGLAAGRARTGGRDVAARRARDGASGQVPRCGRARDRRLAALPPALADLIERPERSERVAADAGAVRRLVERLVTA